MQQIHTIWPIGLGMATEANRDLLDLDAFSDLQMHLSPQNCGLFTAWVLLVIALQVKNGFCEGNTDGNATTSGYNLLIS